jgi:DNA-binding MarR family transcriptional regulator
VERHVPEQDSAPSQLDSHLGYWLRYVSNQVSHAFALKMRARGVTVAEWVVMRNLLDADAKPTILSQRLGMTRGAISKLADRLEAKKLVARRATRGDGRSHVLSLTDEGRKLIPELAALADRNDEEFFGDLDNSVRNTVEAAMKEIVRRRGLKTIPVD